MHNIRLILSTVILLLLLCPLAWSKPLKLKNVVFDKAQKTFWIESESHDATAIIAISATGTSLISENTPDTETETAVSTLALESMISALDEANTALHQSKSSYSIAEQEGFWDTAARQVAGETGLQVLRTLKFSQATHTAASANLLAAIKQGSLGKPLGQAQVLEGGNGGLEKPAPEQAAEGGNGGLEKPAPDQLAEGGNGGLEKPAPEQTAEGGNGGLEKPAPDQLAEGGNGGLEKPAPEQAAEGGNGGLEKPAPDQLAEGGNGGLEKPAPEQTAEGGNGGLEKPAPDQLAEGGNGGLEKPAHEKPAKAPLTQADRAVVTPKTPITLHEQVQTKDQLKHTAVNSNRGVVQSIPSRDF